MRLIGDRRTESTTTRVFSIGAMTRQPVAIVVNPENWRMNFRPELSRPSSPCYNIDTLMNQEPHKPDRNESPAADEKGSVDERDFLDAYLQRSFTAGSRGTETIRPVSNVTALLYFYRIASP